MLRRLYDLTLSLAGHRHAMPALATVSFAESSVFPVPPDALMIPMILARPRRAWAIALVCTLASVAGALLGYFIGWALFESVGQWVLDLYGKADEFDAFAERYNEWGAWAVLVAGVTPFPFKVITIASGVTGLSLPIFIVSSILARAARFFLVAAVLRVFGDSARDFIERRLGLMFTLFCVALIGGFYVIKYV
ncbi:YqaA family protein [Limimaricola pyoseonensis]|uniref:Membrane protein YqaA, SNARE-associated domain n=1 Tax=Limimaricola pyoseonensis TaxID=521013 RepID=A0A1G7A7W8_9RHOB|nr:YqaA family protein [Limimaricola pyoseonensis]SDE10861.1 membrane protein YqaA, SNARE-associated domain [Limimaricola pyoseonensis]